MRLKRSFFHRDTSLVAQELLGKVLVCVNKKGEKVRVTITETEAYHGYEDKASHASRGKTERNKVMFDKAGLVYVYLVYGMHYCLNFTTMGEGFPAAVLVRAVVVDGKEIRGPGRVTKLLGVDKYFYGQDLTMSKHIWVEPVGARHALPEHTIIASKRVGVDYAGKWAKREWNYKIDAI